MVTTTPGVEPTGMFVDANVLIYADLVSSPFHPFSGLTVWSKLFRY